MLRRSVVFSLVFLLLVPFTFAARKKRELVEDKIIQPVLSENDRMLFDYYFNEAIKERYSNRYDEAFALFKHCLDIDSLNAQVWFELSAFYNNMKRADLGLEALEKAYSLDPKNDWYAMGLANAYINLKLFDKAILLYEVLAKSRPEDETIRYYLATLYKQENQWKNALREYKTLEKLIGKNEHVSISKFDIYQKIKEPKKAIKEIQEYVKSNPALIDSHLLLGDCWFELGNVKNAYRYYMEAYEMDSTSPSVALSLADFYSRTGDSVKSNQQLIRALTNPNTDIETKMEILSPMLSAALESGSGDSLQIAHYFSVLLAQHPNEPLLRNVHVEYLMAVGRKSEAKDELRTVLDLNPLQLDVWKQLLLLSAEADNQKEIKTICREALSHYPKEAIFWFYLALSYYPDAESKPIVSDYDQALSFLKKASEVANKTDAPFVSRIYGLLGDIQLSIKDSKSAFDYYEKALSFSPTNLLVLNNYAYYLSEDSVDLIKAEKMSRMTIDAEPNNPTFLDTYAWIFFKQGKFGLAKIYMERALANEPAPSSILVEHYGDILWFNEEKEAALEQWKKALELDDPSDELVQKVEKSMYVKQLNSQK